jgi:hypothetical protein
MKYRKLRIAWLVACGILCLLLIAMWVRSYWRHDRVFGHTSTSGVLEVQSLQGTLIWIDGVEPSSKTVLGDGWYFESNRTQAQQGHTLLPGFATQQYSNVVEFEVPYWFLFLVAVSIAASPWLHWRFSLGTLLIGMTVVAAVLGAVVWAFG